MVNETKIKVTQWVTFAVTIIGFIGKVVLEVIAQIPQKGE